VEVLSPVVCYAILNDSFDIHTYSTSAMLRGISNILSPHLKKMHQQNIYCIHTTLIHSV